MDDLRKTFKDLFSGGGKKFEGTGRKLGSGGGSDGASGSGGGAATGASRRAPPPPPPRARPPPPPPPPSEQTLKPAAEFSPFTAVVGGGAARNVIREEAPPPPAPPPPPLSLPPPPRSATPAERDAIADALALVRMCPLATAEQSLPLFAKILRNAVVGAIALHRQLRLGNPRVRKAIVDVEGGLALLTAAGFVVVPSAGGGEGEDGEDGALAVLTPDDDALARAHEALAQVERGLEVPAAPAAAVAAAPPPAPKPRPTPPQQPPPPIIPRRCASLILPVAPDSQPLPEAFFQRTAHEVRDEYKALVARRQRGELLLTRAAREAAARGGGGGPAAAASTTALVRIRLPDGCSLEGRFGAGEPYEAVREFVRAALREPRMAFELRGPTGADKQPATTKPTETVREAGLCPSAVLNFRPLLAGGGGAVALASSGVLLKDEVLSGGSWA